MQDALLIYYMVANLLHAGYSANVAKAVQQAAERLRAVMIGLRNSDTARSAAAAGAMPQTIDRVPAACRELEDWVQRLMRMESYILSMR
jgi:hypothetical protein